MATARGAGAHLFTAMRQGQCKRCRRQAWVNLATRNEKPLGEFCADCFEVIHHDAAERSQLGGSSGPFHDDNDPGWDNVIRALEEDR